MPKDGRAIGDAVRQVLLPIWNAYSFFTLYANIDGIKGRLVTTAEAELDRYILGKTRGAGARRRSGDGPARHRRAPATRCRRSSRRSTTGTSAARATASGRARRTPTSAPPTTRSTPRSSRMTRAMAPFLPYLTETHPPRAGRRRERASPGLAGRVGLRGRRGAGRAHGPRPRRLLGRGLDPHGEEPPQPPAAPRRSPSPIRSMRCSSRSATSSPRRRTSRTWSSPTIPPPSAPRCCRSIRASSASASAAR